jgi:hypothetical protein
MSNVVVKTPMQYLDKAAMALRDLGIMPPATAGLGAGARGRVA